MSIIRTSHLTKYYGKSRGIVDVDLSVEQGDIFGFIGPNGAGKSTMIRLLLGLIGPTEGQATVFGKDILKHKMDILRDVGYLPSEAMFYSGMQVHELIAYSAKLRKADCRAEAKRLCDRLQLNTRMRVDALSLGNRKKVGIVCALQHKPALYLLDEPTGGLDPLMQREFFQLLQERHREGATVFLSSHVLSEVQQHCNKAAIIREGRIIACDSVEALSKTKARRVVLYGVTQPIALAGVKDLHVGEGTVSFLYHGDMKVLIRGLQDLPVTDMTVTEPDLNEIFMHYYEEGDEQG